MARKTSGIYRNALRAAGLGMALAALTLTQAKAQDGKQVGGELLQELLAHPNSFKGTATLPIVFCWYKGQPALYIRTDASDPTAAAQQGVNLVPRLSNAIDAPNGAVDDIYQIVNFTQGNVIPSAPKPTGPKNSDPDYTPLWQVTNVTWNKGVKPRLLTSEEAILSARDAREVTLDKTKIVINCPVIYTPEGGKLPTVKIRLEDRDGDDHGERN